MKIGTQTTRGPSIGDIPPLIGTEHKRKAFGEQRERSEKALVACRRPRLRDWLLASLPLGCFYGMFLAVGAIIFAAWTTDGATENSARSYAIGSIALAFVSCAALYRTSRFRGWRKALAQCGPEERAWHERFIAIHPRVIGFDRRLDALQQFSMNAEQDADIDETIVLKYSEERAALDRELRTLNREQALLQFEQAVDASTDGRFRCTRDVTDQLFVYRARHEDADRQIAELTAPHEQSRIRVTGTIPVSQPPDDDADEADDDEESSAPTTLRSGRAPRV